MTTHESRARPVLGTRCRCEHPLIDGGTCLRCGRFPVAAPRPAVRADQERAVWTRAGVVRVIRAFTFFRGRPPAPDDWSGPMGPEWPPLHVIDELFGSLENVLQVSRPSSEA